MNTVYLVYEPLPFPDLQFIPLSEFESAVLETWLSETRFLPPKKVRREILRVRSDDIESLPREALMVRVNGNTPVFINHTMKPALNALTAIACK